MQYFQIPPNLNKYPIRIQGFHSPPFTIDLEADGIDGIDIKLMQSIADHMNFTPIFEFVGPIQID